MLFFLYHETCYTSSKFRPILMSIQALSSDENFEESQKTIKHLGTQTALGHLWSSRALEH